MKLKLAIEGTDSKSVITIRNRDLKFKISITVCRGVFFLSNKLLYSFFPFQLLYISLIPFVSYEIKINARRNWFEIGNHGLKFEISIIACRGFQSLFFFPLLNYYILLLSHLFRTKLAIEGTDRKSVRNRDSKFEIWNFDKTNKLSYSNPFFLSTSQLLHISSIPFVSYEIRISDRRNRFGIGNHDSIRFEIWNFDNLFVEDSNLFFPFYFSIITYFSYPICLVRN